MVQIVPGRFTAKMDEPFVVFVIGMWLPFHKDPAAIDRRVIRARDTRRPTVELPEMIKKAAEEVHDHVW